MSIILEFNQIFMGMYCGNIENRITIPKVKGSFKMKLEKQLMDFLVVY